MNMVEELEYDVFLCYHSAGGQDYALHLWRKLPDYGLRAFINIKDVDEIYEQESDEYRQVIDKAIKNCKYFIIIMTRGFKDREEIKREYKLARDTERKIIHCKYHNLEHKNCIMNINGKDYDLSKIDYVSFSNNSNLYNRITDTIEGKTPPRILNVDPLKKELFDKFFLPIYSDITDIIERFEYEGCDFGYFRHEYDELRKKKAFHLKKYGNKELLSKIEKFYTISDDRQKHLKLYPDKANKIINQCVESMSRTIGRTWDISKDRAVCIDVKYNVENNMGKIEEKDTNLSYDVLYLENGVSLLRNQVNRKLLNFTRVLLHRTGGAALDISFLWDELYACIKSMSEVDDTLKYLRDSVEIVYTLGNKILKEIEKEFSDYY